MASENTKLDIVNERPTKSQEIDRETLDFVFGKDETAGAMELINNEKKHNGVKPTDNFIPLLEPDRNKKPPLAGRTSNKRISWITGHNDLGRSEVDDLDGDPPANGAYPGIDDGLLDANDKPHILDIGDELDDDKTEPETREDGVGVGTDDDGKWPWMGGDEPDYPYDLSPRFGPDDRPFTPAPTSIDLNTYQQKKNLAQGMMDLALLSANANQLRYVLESASNHPYYYSSLVFISLSIIFQIAVGVGLILNSRYDVNDKKEVCKADKINNFTVLGIFLITIVNVFITSFSVATVPVAVQTPGGPVIQQAG